MGAVDEAFPLNEMVLWLIALFVVSFLGSSFLPLPVTITVIRLGQFHFPVLVILVGTIGTVLGWIAMRGFFGKLLARKPALVDRIPKSYHRYVLNRTGFWLFVSNALPFPVDVVRILAFVNGYSPTRMLWIIAAGRLVRNALLVCLGRAIMGHPLLFWGTMIFFLVLPPVLDWTVQKFTKQS